MLNMVSLSGLYRSTIAYLFQSLMTGLFYPKPTKTSVHKCESWQKYEWHLNLFE